MEKAAALVDLGDIVDAKMSRLKSNSELETARIRQAVYIEFCKSKIASYKTPKTVDLIEIIPRNPSGKILKKVLREPFWAGKDRQVG